MIIFVSTGLGLVHRGFEQYIHSLANTFSILSDGRFRIKVYGVKKPAGEVNYDFRPISSLRRDGWVLKNHPNASRRLRYERFSFWISMLPWLWFDKPAAIYLGEYPIFGWLSKWRKWGFLNTNLALYTGGQAVPGIQVFNPTRDYVHHITNVYLSYCNYIPPYRQCLLPHFIDNFFIYNDVVYRSLRKKAGSKKIILSVGAIEKSSKRMHLFLQALAPLRNQVFPVLLGEPTPDNAEIATLAENLFGKGHFHIAKVGHAELGSWYQAADGFVLCSPKESFGLALIEALYHGLPVACYRFPETEFVMQQHAHWLYKTQPVELSTELSEWISKWPAYRVCSVSAHRFIQNRYALAALQKAYIDMFLQIINPYANKTTY